MVINILLYKGILLTANIIIFTSLHNIFYVLECRRLQKNVAEYATLRKN